MKLKPALLAAGMTLVAAVATSSPASAALITPNTNAVDLANTLISQPQFLSSASFATGPSSGSATGVAGPGVGNDFPTDGPSFSVLTTGDVAIADPPNDSSSSGTGNSTTFRDVNDVTTLKVDVSIPSNYNCIGFDFTFYSEEFPEFVGSRFNDFFLAELDRNDWTYNTDSNAVTAPGNFAYDTNGAQLTVNTALGSNQDTGLEYDGSTVTLRARTPITAGNHSVYFTVADAGDHIYDTAVFLDNLRAANVPPGQCVAGAAPADSDGDGLSNDWEENGVDVDNDGTVDLDIAAMGADPLHKDLFVELDYMAGHQLPVAATNIVVNSFSNSPVTNPDGTTGINLHVDNGSGSTMNPVTGDTWGANSRSNSITHRNVLGSNTASGYSWAAFDTRKSSNFNNERVPVFRYAMSIHQFGSAATLNSGIARAVPTPGSDFIVALGRTDAAGTDSTIWGTNGQAGTFMHELGHTLGLWHGGNDYVNYKPNYLSIMNYNFQVGGLNRTTTATALYDYSRYDTATAAGTVAALDENSLSEDAGITTTGAASNFWTLRYCNGDDPNSVNPQPRYRMNRRVDWNCDATTGGTVATSINGYADLEGINPSDDWAKLRYRGGAVGGTGLAGILPATTAPTDEVSVKRLQKLAAAVTGDTKRPRVKIKLLKRSGDKVRLKFTARDNKAMDNLVVRLSKSKKKIVFANKGGKVKQGKIKKSEKRRKKVLVYKRYVKRNSLKKLRVIAYDQAGNVSKVARYKKVKSKKRKK